MKKKLFTIILANICFITLMHAQYKGGIGDGYGSDTTAKVLPTPVLSNNGPICSGSDLELYAPFISGATYTWSGPNGFSSSGLELDTAIVSSATIDATGTYQLTITLSNGVENSSPAQTTAEVFEIPSAPTSLAGAVNICGINDTIQPYTTPTNANYESYIWQVNPSASIDSISTDGTNTKTIYWKSSYSGDATVEVAGQNMCGTSDYFIKSVSINPLLGTSTLTEEDSICQGIETSIIQIDSIDNATGYSWSLIPSGSGTIDNTLGSDTIIEITWTPAYTGDVKIVLDYDNDCNSDSDTLFFKINTIPAASVISNTDICNGDNISIGDANVATSTYAWSANPADATLTGQENMSNPSVAPIVTTTYTLVEEDIVSGCTNSDSVVITVNLYPEQPDLTLEKDSLCFGQATSDYSITPVVGAISYNWSIQPPSAGTISYTSDTEITINWDAAFTGTSTLYVNAENACGLTENDSTVIDVNPLPTVNIVGNQEICNGDELNIGGTAVADYSYNWTSEPAGFTSSDANPLVSPTETTTYYLEVTNTLTTCAENDSVVITVNQYAEQPNLPLDQDSLCIGQSTSTYTISPTAGATGYNWSLQPTSAGTLTYNSTTEAVITWATDFTGTAIIYVNAESTCGLTENDSTIIDVNPLPTVDIVGNQEICNGDELNIGGTAVANYSYNWTSEPTGFTSSDANPLVSPTETTTYYLEVTNTLTTCAENDSVVVTVNQYAEQPNLPLDQDSLCIGQSTSTYTISPTAGATGYNWSLQPASAGTLTYNSTTEAVITWATDFTGTAIIYVNAENDCGLTDNDSTVIEVNPLPIVDIIEDQEICASDETNIGGTSIPDYSYSWTSNPSGFTSSEANPLVAPNETTTYYLEVTNNLSECINSDSVVLSVTPYPEQPDLPLVEDNICIGTATSDYSIAPVAGATGYNWALEPISAGAMSFTSDTEVTITWEPDFIGTATLFVDAENTCGTSDQDSTVIYMNDQPTVNIAEDQDICNGDEIAIGGEDVTNYSYSWTSDPSGFASTEANPVVMPSVTTTYYLEVTDDNTSCINTGEVVITVLPSAGIPTTPSGATYVEIEDVPVTEQYTTEAENAIGFIWSISPEEAGTILGGENDTITVEFNPGFEGFVDLDVQAYNDCDTSLAATANIEVKNIGILEMSSNKISIYPNPAKNNIFIESEIILDDVEFKIYNSFGQMIRSEKLILAPKTSIDISSYAKGVYTLEMRFRNSIVKKKIYIQ